MFTSQDTGGPDLNTVIIRSGVGVAPLWVQQSSPAQEFSPLTSVVQAQTLGAVMRNQAAILTCVPAHVLFLLIRSIPSTANPGSLNNRFKGHPSILHSGKQRTIAGCFVKPTVRIALTAGDGFSLCIYPTPHSPHGITLIERYILWLQHVQYLCAIIQQ